jgi:hypothetical protein
VDPYIASLEIHFGPRSGSGRLFLEFTLAPDDFVDRGIVPKGQKYDSLGRRAGELARQTKAKQIRRALNRRDNAARDAPGRWVDSD